MGNDVLDMFAADSEDEKALMEVDNENDGNGNEGIEPEPEEVQQEEKEEVKQEVKTEEKAEEPKQEEFNDVARKLQEQVDNLNKALKQERWETRQKMQLLSDFKEYVQKTQQPTQVQQVPDFNESPLEHLKSGVDTTAETLRKIEERQMELERQTQQATESNNFRTSLLNSENSFRMKTHDYDNAFNYLIDFRKKELELVGISDAEEQLNEIRRNSEALSRAALAQGRNPAEVVYSLAKQYGYKTPEAKAETTKDTSIEQHIDTVKKAQSKAAKTLSGGGGGENEETFASILSSNGKDFEEKWKAMFGEY